MAIAFDMVQPDVPQGFEVNSFIRLPKEMAYFLIFCLFAVFPQVPNTGYEPDLSEFLDLAGINQDNQAIAGTPQPYLPQGFDYIEKGFEVNFLIWQLKEKVVLFSYFIFLLNLQVHLKILMN